MARDGGDPDALRKPRTVTFWEAAETVYSQLLPTWKNAKHAETWLRTVRNHAKPRFGDRPIDTVTAADLLMVLSPIWTERHETAGRLRRRLAAVFDGAKGAGRYPRKNPVSGLKKALPVVKRRAEPHDARPWAEVLGFKADLALREGVSARYLESIILAAARSGEARGARGAEIDSAKAVWTVPAERMKRGIPHRVPLSPQALAVLGKVKSLDADLVLSSAQRDRAGHARPMSDMEFKQLLTRMMREGFTTHGFRSSFRDWASESAHAEREVAEAALSHATGNEVERG